MPIAIGLMISPVASQSSSGGGGEPEPDYEGPEMVGAFYGQSNSLRHLSESSSPPAAAAGTYYWNGSSWTTPPAGNGVRTFLNAVRAATGKTVGVISGGQAGTGLSDLLEGAGTGYYEAVQTQIVASDAANAPEAFILFTQGENEANSAAPNIPAHKANINTLHQSFADDFGRAKSEIPFLIGSIATVSSLTVGTDATQAAIQAALVTVHDTYPDIHYSHSNLDAVLTDGIHWNAAAYGRSGARFARTLLDLRGDVATSPPWFIASAAIVDDTHTDVTLVHSMGTDFTPTSGITGFEISNDNWATSASISAAARQSATVIRLTHANLGAAADRAVRYQYQYDADITGVVLDNSTLASPLNHSDHQTIVAEGAGALPSPTYRFSAASNDSDNIQTWPNIDLGTASEELLGLFMVEGPFDLPVLSATLTPSGGSPISASIEAQHQVGGRNATIACLKFVIPNGTANINNGTLDVTFSANPFNRSRAHGWTVPTGDMSSTTLVDSDATSSSAATVLTRDLTTSAGGFYIAAAVSSNSGTSCTWTGDDSIAERADAQSFGATHTAADASNTTALTNANTVTATMAASGHMALLVVSYR